MEHSGERGDLFDTNLGSLFGKQLFEIPFSALENAVKYYSYYNNFSGGLFRKVDYKEWRNNKIWKTIGKSGFDSIIGF